MKVLQHVEAAFRDMANGYLDPALMHACAAVDGTSKKLSRGKIKGNAQRYKECLRRYYWILEPMTGLGINFDETKFSNVPLPKIKNPDFADIIYEVIRCTHAHGDELPSGYSFSINPGGFNTTMTLGQGHLEIPDRLVWALIGIAVLSHVNHDQNTKGGEYLILGSDEFLVRRWWGREVDFKPYARKYSRKRIVFDGLDGFDPNGFVEDHVTIYNPPDHLPRTRSLAKQARWNEN